MDARRWQVNCHSHLHWRQLGEDWVVFDAGSGDTHQLDAVSAAALMCFESEPNDLSGVIAVLANELGLPIDEHLSNKFELLLEQLSSLELIELVEP